MVIARDNYIVPLGMRGTVISILPISDPNPVRQENINAVDHILEILFDVPFERGTTVPGVDGNRVLKVRKSVLINISHGIGKLHSHTYISHVSQNLNEFNFEYRNRSTM